MCSLDCIKDTQLNFACVYLQFDTFFYTVIYCIVYIISLLVFEVNVLSIKLENKIIKLRTVDFSCAIVLDANVFYSNILVYHVTASNSSVCLHLCNVRKGMCAAFLPLLTSALKEKALETVGQLLASGISITPVCLQFVSRLSLPPAEKVLQDLRPQ